MAKTRRRAYGPRNEEQKDAKYGKRGNARATDRGPGKSMKPKREKR